MNSSTVLLLAFLIGLSCGLRSLTPPAVVAWAAHASWLKLASGLLYWLGSLPAAIVFTVAALFELFNDKRPATPARTAPPAFIARLLMGALCGAAIALAGTKSIPLGALVGILGAVVGTLGGYQARKGLVKALSCPDIAVALVEDAVTICLALFVVSRY